MGLVSRVLSLMYSHQYNHLSRMQVTLHLKRSTCSKSPENNCCLILLQMRFAGYICYQIYGSLLHCLFTLTNGLMFAVYFLLHYLSVTGFVQIMENCTKPIYCPVIIRHFFRRSPDFRLIILFYHQDRMMQLCPIC
jgi:hypothetical protein